MPVKDKIGFFVKTQMTSRIRIPSRLVPPKIACTLLLEVVDDICDRGLPALLLCVILCIFHGHRFLCLAPSQITSHGISRRRYPKTCASSSAPRSAKLVLKHDRSFCFFYTGIVCSALGEPSPYLWWSAAASSQLPPWR